MPIKHDYAQCHFGWLVPTQKRLLTTREVGHFLRRNDDFVRELIDIGKLESHQDSAFGDGNRLSNRVTSRSVVVHLARTATYNSSEAASALAEAAKTLPQAERKDCIKHILPGFSRDSLSDLSATISQLLKHL